MVFLLLLWMWNRRNVRCACSMFIYLGIFIFRSQLKLDWTEAARRQNVRECEELNPLRYKLVIILIIIVFMNTPFAIVIFSPKRQVKIVAAIKIIALSSSSSLNSNAWHTLETRQIRCHCNCHEAWDRTNDEKLIGRWWQWSDNKQMKLIVSQLFHLVTLTSSNRNQLAHCALHKRSRNRSIRNSLRPRAVRIHSLHLTSPLLTSPHTRYNYETAIDSALPLTK